MTDYTIDPGATIDRLIAERDAALAELKTQTLRADAAVGDANEAEQRLTAADEEVGGLKETVALFESQYSKQSDAMTAADERVSELLIMLRMAWVDERVSGEDCRRIDAALKPAEGGGGDHVKHYECIGKGGDYTVVAIAQGAGTLKGFNHYVYKNADGVHFVRDPEDFLSRMQIKP